MIRSLLLSGVATLALATAAFAADLPNVKGPPVFTPPPPPPVFSWAGAYIGGQIGYQWGRTDTNIIGPGGGTFDYFDENSRGVVGGAHAGYNWQVTQFVFGLEGDVDGSGYEGSGPGLFGRAGINVDRIRIPVEGSIRGRAGIAFDRILIYATGGAAFADNTTATSLVLPLQDSQSTGRVGWTVGAGAEYAVTDNWSIRAEYRYSDYGSLTMPLINTSPFGLDRLHERVRDNMATVGFSYKFDMFTPPAPVVAKY